jgi:hypothetical protein
LLDAPTPASVDDLAIAMSDVESQHGAVLQESGTTTFDHLEVAGALNGPAVKMGSAQATFADSRLIASSA